MAKKNNPNLYKAEDQRRMIGDGLSFAASEAYKLLRTNLMFSLPDESGCQIIGVTSAMRGEGKSTTAINMAYSMAQTGQRVAAGGGSAPAQHRQAAAYCFQTRHQQSAGGAVQGI